ncbi:sulfite exporter TauE/SafE family protein [sulfur-oxidizing endosymbiont of Gigantopelta aegis]|uniref:sulfite exporter TauE/SafE family protein n=1 Tax=sulfur-oxidizing endosymbiont of Gigantopelta aegis TaxID=2794934 RepID=UPI0018DB4858|nr:sulfite exporter TauE/SafE family protein [sulfur-oxidizing endosymbiont of Gigantopelta aegis]
MEIWQILILFFVGLFAGWLNVMAGGGSLLTIPTMLLMDIPAPVANGTNRIAILAQNITAVYTFFRKGFSDIKLSLSLSAFASIGAVGGAWFGVSLDGVWFDRMLAMVMILVMIVMATEKKKPLEQTDNNTPLKVKNLALGHFLMILAGFWGGFIQIGVGFIFMPILHRVMGFDLVRVNMYKVFIILNYTIVALFIYASQLQLLWWTGLGLALGNSIGGWYGAHTTINKGEKWIKIVLYVALTGFIIKLLFFS